MRGGAAGHGGRGGGGRAGRRARGTVYVATADNRLRAIPVRVGISDGALTAVEPLEAGALDVGLEVVTAIVKEEEAATTNPLSGPRMGPGGGGRGGR